MKVDGQNTLIIPSGTSLLNLPLMKMCVIDILSGRINQSKTIRYFWTAITDYQC